MNIHSNYQISPILDPVTADISSLIYVSEDTGIGNPKKASAEKGKRYVEAVTAKYAQLFKELTEEIYQ